ncbi:MAG TPA: 2-hydroxyacyl-CoA dehydratase family protein, partial [Anaeromyxobacteraceae bacterium]|nr:2-hydroxyacyl-CoA dehydratase family protein [Anaeromyxobacteraceae bacterium]
TRAEYIERQRALHGRRSVAVLPVHFPKPLLTALDVLSVELWGPPGPPRGDAAGRLQPYVCAVGRNALAFLASGGADAVDAVLFPHTCDTIQGLATLVTDLGGWSKRAFTFLHPRGLERPGVRAFLETELRALAGGLEALSGRRLEPARLAAAIRLHDAIDAERAALLDGRARLDLSDPELYALLRRGEWLWPEEHLAELRAARAARLREAAVQAGVPVLVSGYVPEPAGVLEALGGAGAYVAADDYAAVGRRVVRAARGDPQADPWGALVERHLAAPPCPTRAADQASRLRWLEGLLDRSGARGVLLHLVKFCEPELFDVPAIKAAFTRRGVPVLVVEGELEAALPAQVLTRIEAFVELLSSGRAA